jgi:hypothetical protein
MLFVQVTPKARNGRVPRYGVVLAFFSALLAGLAIGAMVMRYKLKHASVDRFYPGAPSLLSHLAHRRVHTAVQCALCSYTTF